MRLIERMNAKSEGKWCDVLDLDILYCDRGKLGFIVDLEARGRNNGQRKAWKVRTECDTYVDVSMVHFCMRRATVLAPCWRALEYGHSYSHPIISITISDLRNPSLTSCAILTTSSSLIPATSIETESAKPGVPSLGPRCAFTLTVVSLTSLLVSRPTA